jgi:DNA-binding transcriptional regulator of glucitol operon
VLVIVAAAGCLALGWWQWQRFESASGTGQNLGYALQWPLFAGFVVYAYRKFVRYEEEPQLHKPDEVTEIPAGLLPERPEPVRDDNALIQHSPNTTPILPNSLKQTRRTVGLISDDRKCNRHKENQSSAHCLPRVGMGHRDLAYRALL